MTQVPNDDQKERERKNGKCKEIDRENQQENQQRWWKKSIVVFCLYGKFVLGIFHWWWWWWRDSISHSLYPSCIYNHVYKRQSERGVLSIYTLFFCYCIWIKQPGISKSFIFGKVYVYMILSIDSKYEQWLLLTMMNEVD